MSKKTFIKRIASVASLALASAGLSLAAAPSANATLASPSVIGSVTVGTIPAARPGGTTTIPIFVNLSSVGAASDTVTIAARVISGPIMGGVANAASALTKEGSSGTTQDNGLEVLWFSATSAGAEAVETNGASTRIAAAGTTGGVAGSYCDGYAGTTATATGALDATTAGCATAAAMTYTAASATDYTVEGWLNIKPDVAGTYTLLVSASVPSTSGSGNKSYVAGDKNTTITVTTSGSPTTVTLSAVGGSSTTHASGSYGALYKVSLTDAAGLPATLVGSETVDVTSAGYEAAATVSSGVYTSVAPSSSTTCSLTASNFLNGVAFCNILGTSAGTLTITATGTAGLSSSVTTATSATVRSTAWTGSRVFAKNGGTVVTKGFYGTTPNFDVRSTQTSTTLEWTFSDPGATAYGYVNVLDEGAISGLGTINGNALYFDRAFTVADDDTYHTLTFTHSALGDTTSTGATFTVTESGDATAATALVISGDPAGATTITASPSAPRSAPASSVSLVVTLADQFGVAMNGASVTATVAGRNAARASETKITDADGRTSWTITDAGTTGSLDTVTFSSSTGLASGSATGTASITWGTFTVGSVLLTTPNTSATTGADEYPVDPEDIAAGDGAEAGIKTVTALVKDSAGVVLSGVPVTFTISGTGAAVLSTTQTVTTGVAGTASASVYGWIAGTYTVTATAGGVSDTAPFIIAQETDEEARTISASVSGNRVTATVKDRFGNVVTSGVNVVATVTAGDGVLGSSSTATSVTGLDGTVTFVITGGSATVKLAFESTTFGQSDAIKGNVSSPTATDVFTDYTAGTALEAEEGVGASYDEAGVNSVSVEVAYTDSAATAAEAASDAALEAIDAANAATDAANLAAEAADAATVAAEEARDAADAATAAVEALASEVATLMAALKAQLTTLAKTVAKIAKKVKA